ncbi:methylcobamide--CoM methyltransferase [Bacteroides salyersiae]|mgnify:CR=1 FL=1|nr:uroporphyrinogen decarboxylase family protein [Bacteroides salyersiae]MBT9875408.1 methylcobamide--CoM methyltransferase [Bacteroides salyersiae]
MIQTNQWISDCLKGKKRFALPFMTHPGIELCNKTIKEAVMDGKVQAQAIIKMNDLFPADGVTTIMDLTVEAEAFGSQIIFKDHEMPTVSGRLVHDAASVNNLTIPSLEQGRISQYLLAERLAVEAIQNKPTFGGCIGPFSLAGRLYGLSELLMELYIDPDTIISLLEKCTAFIKDYCIAIKKTGIHGVIIAEPAAGLISNDDCIRYSTIYIQQIVETVQDEDFIVILHNCGNTGHCTDAMIKSGAKGLHFGNKIDIAGILNDIPENILVMGNIDPVGVFKQATVQEVYDLSLCLLNKTAGKNNFILSSGCDVPPEIPLENIKAFYRAINDYNNQEISNDFSGNGCP